MVCLFWHSMYVTERFNANHTRYELLHILHHWKEDELLYQNTWFVMIHLDSNDFHDSVNPNHFFHLVKTTGLDHMAVLAENNYGILQYFTVFPLYWLQTKSFNFYSSVNTLKHQWASFVLYHYIIQKSTWQTWNTHLVNNCYLVSDMMWQGQF